MIRAHMATYPARRETMPIAVASLAPQVYKLVVVLNEYEEVPAELAPFENVEPVIPETDLKDTGKYLPEPAPEDHVFLVDDDLIYDDAYVARTLDVAAACPIERAVFGYHGSWLRRGFRGKGFVRGVSHFGRSQPEDIVVDMLGTGTVYARGRDLPPLDYMRDAQRFTDVRFAKWCHEQGLVRVCLRRPHRFIREQRVGESIFESFTRQLPSHVFDEVKAFGRRTPGVAGSVANYLELSSVGVAGRAKKR